MNFIIEKIPNLEIAYIRRTGSYGIGNTDTMEKIKAFAKKNSLLDDNSVLLGIAQDNPNTTESELCRYDACIVIRDKFILDKLIENKVFIDTSCIEEAVYAVFEIDHTSEAITKAWTSIFQVLMSAGYKIDPSKPIIERYATFKLMNHKCEICVPIL